MGFELERQRETEETNINEITANADDMEVTEADFEDCSLDEISENDEYIEYEEEGTEADTENFEDCFKEVNETGETDEYYEEIGESYDVDFEDCRIEDAEDTGEAPDETDEPEDDAENIDEVSEIAEDTGEVPEETDELEEDAENTGEMSEIAEDIGEVSDETEETDELEDDAENTGEVSEIAEDIGEVPDETEETGELEEDAENTGEVSEIAEDTGEVPDETEETDELEDDAENSDEVSEIAEDSGETFEETEKISEDIEETSEDAEKTEDRTKEIKETAETIEKTGETPDETVEHINESDEELENAEEAAEKAEETSERAEEVSEEAEAAAKEAEEKVNASDENSGENSGENSEDSIEKIKEAAEETEKTAEVAEEAAEEAAEAAEELEDAKNAEEAAETAEAVERREEYEEYAEKAEEYEADAETDENIEDNTENNIEDDIEEFESADENEGGEYRSQILEKPADIERLENNHEKRRELESERGDIQSRLNKLNESCAEKFGRLEAMDRSDPEYKELLREYNDARDRAAEEFEKLSEKDSEIAQVRIEQAELEGSISKQAETALENSSETEEISSALHKEYERYVYSENRDTAGMQEFVRRNSEHTEKLKADAEAVRQAIELQKLKMAEFHRTNAESVDLMNNPQYISLAAEKKRLEEYMKSLDYSISETETDRKLIERRIDESRQRNTIRDRVSSFFGGFIHHENTEETAEREIKDIEAGKAAFEEVSESAEEKAKEKLERLKDTDIRELDERRRKELIGAVVETTLEKHGAGLSAERIEKIRNGIEFVEPEEIKEDTGAEDPSYILGYYSSASDKIKINSSPAGKSGSAADIAATIDHECMHMISQSTNRSGKASGRVTGLKDIHCVRGNVGMNEGVTELYSIRNVHGYAPEYVSESYVDEVEIMEAFESVCGKELMYSAYINHNVDILRDDFDAVMGRGSFRSFCNTMDNMYLNSSIGNRHGASMRKAELFRTIEQYRKGKGGRA